MRLRFDHILRGTAAVAALALSACAGSPAPLPAEAPVAPTLVPVSQVDWQALNPARGDASPRAGTLWGDRGADVATGFLVRFVDGFSSPPHIHNVSHRGVVIEGLVHNDDASAEKLWMPPGSFWTQPAGGPHITASQGESMAYIEIDAGPYLVRPLDQAFDNGETPVNMPPPQIPWRNVGASPGDKDAERVRVAELWGAAEGEGPRGIMVKVPAGTATALRSAKNPLKAVLVAGKADLAPAAGGGAGLEPGSYYRGQGVVPVACGDAGPCTLYVTGDGPIAVDPLP